jgi:hypothetical protein
MQPWKVGYFDADLLMIVCVCVVRICGCLSSVQKVSVFFLFNKFLKVRGEIMLLSCKSVVFQIEFLWMKKKIRG